MGVLFVGSFFVARLNREWHVDALLERAGRGGPLVAGAAFAIAWTPCVGPTLGAIKPSPPSTATLLQGMALCSRSTPPGLRFRSCSPRSRSRG